MRNFSASLLLFFLAGSSANAGPILGSTLAGFTILGGSGVSNSPTSSITGNVGVWSSGGANSITGFNSSPGVAVSDPQVTGTVQSGTFDAQLAQSQLTATINALNAMTGTLEPSDLSGLTLTPGVYTVPAGASNLTGTLTLNGGGNANALWIFLLPSTLITSSGSVVNVINTGSGAGLFWNVGSSATLASGTNLQGNVLAHDSITMLTNGTDGCGRLLASTGSVTVHLTTLSTGCSGALTGSYGLSGGLSVTSVPEPGTFWLLNLSLAGLILFRGASGVQSLRIRHQSLHTQRSTDPRA